MKKNFEMPVVNVERFEVTDVVTVSGVGFGMYEDSGKGSFEYFLNSLGANDTRLG